MPALPRSLRALRHRNYRLFFSGQVFSLAGQWMQTTAQLWLVNEITKDPFKLGLVSFMAQFPVLALGLFAGIVVDLVNRHRLIVITQSLFMIQATTLATLTLWHKPDGSTMVTYEAILMLALFGGILQAFDLPARQSFILYLTPKEDLGNAVALNSMSFNLARAIGPSVAGVLIAWINGFRIPVAAAAATVAGAAPPVMAMGEGVCFAANAASYIFILFNLFRIRPPQSARIAQRPSRDFLADGFRYVSTRPHIKHLLFYAGAMAMFGFPYHVLMPIFASTLLNGDSRVYGSLMTSVGLGAMLGGIILARRADSRGMGKVILVMTFSFSAALLAFAWNHSVFAGCVIAAVAGFSISSAMIGAQTLVQTLVSEKYRGRIMSLYSMLTIGTMPIGSLITGFESRHLGPRVTLTIMAGLIMATAVIFMIMLPKTRISARSSPEYRELFGEPTA